MSQPPNTRSLRSASGRKSLISGERPSVRLPSRMVPICVSEPIGFAMPLRTASTPAMNVVATAPMPTTKIPSLPLAGEMVAGIAAELSAGVFFCPVGIRYESLPYRVNINTTNNLCSLLRCPFGKPVLPCGATRQSNGVQSRVRMRFSTGNCDQIAIERENHAILPAYPFPIVSDMAMIRQLPCL